MIETIAKIADVAKEISASAKDIIPKFFDDLPKPNETLDADKPVDVKKELTSEQKDEIKNETGWCDEIIDSINSMQEFDIYRDAGLKETEVNGRKCLVRDIDMNYVDEKTGMTNRELMEKGRSPIDVKTGEKVELHHMGQNYDSPLAELTSSEHGDNHGILHDNKVGSWRNDDTLKNKYNNVDKPTHWKSRVDE